MDKQIFINLPVADLQKSVAFYEALGFEINPQFSDDAGKCMVWSQHIFLMILSHDKFNNFATKPIANTKDSLAGLYSVSLESIDEVNRLTESGVQAGGHEPNEVRNYGFMVQRTLEDPDGHTWELFHMDMSKFPGA